MLDARCDDYYLKSSTEHLASQQLDQLWQDSPQCPRAVADGLLRVRPQFAESAVIFNDFE